jgi:hypothetical protein
LATDDAPGVVDLSRKLCCLAAEGVDGRGRADSENHCGDGDGYAEQRVDWAVVGGMSGHVLLLDLGSGAVGLSSRVTWPVSTCSVRAICCDRVHHQGPCQLRNAALSTKHALSVTRIEYTPLFVELQCLDFEPLALALEQQEA